MKFLFIIMNTSADFGWNISINLSWGESVNDGVAVKIKDF